MVCGAEHPDTGAASALLTAAVGSWGSGMLQQSWCKTQVRQQEYLSQLRTAPDRRGGDLGSQGDLLKIKFSWEAAQALGRKHVPQSCRDGRTRNMPE